MPATQHAVATGSHCDDSRRRGGGGGGGGGGGSGQAGHSGTSSIEQLLARIRSRRASQSRLHALPAAQRSAAAPFGASTRASQFRWRMYRSPIGRCRRRYASMSSRVLSQHAHTSPS